MNNMSDRPALQMYLKKANQFDAEVADEAVRKA